MINLKQALEDKYVIDPLLKKVNQERNRELIELKNKRDSYNRYILDYTRSTKTYKKSLKEVENQIEKTKSNTWELKDLIKSINQIRKNKSVDWAILTKDLELIVQTKMLYQYEPFEGITTKEPVGRYAFYIQFGSYNSLYFYVSPLDFSAQGYRHPNVMGGNSPCWGAISIDLQRMARSGEFYNLIDTLVVFFSTFPHEGGHKPEYWLIWLNERKLDFKQNPWIEKEAIYTIGKRTIPKPVKLVIEKKDRVPFNKGELSLTGLRFRNY